MNTYVVEPKSHDSEAFDPIRLQTSIMGSCLAVRAFEGEAHLAAQHVCQSVISWLADKTEVTARDIRRIAAEALQVYHPEAAYLYENEQYII